MPEWDTVGVSLIVTLLFLLVAYALAASSYGDWVREFYARRDRRQTLFGNDKKTGK